MNEWIKSYCEIVKAFGGVPDAYEFRCLSPQNIECWTPEEAAEFDLIEQGIIADNGRTEVLLDKVVA